MDHPQIIAYCSLWLCIICAFLKMEREVASQTSILQLCNCDVHHSCCGIVWLWTCHSWGQLRNLGVQFHASLLSLSLSTYFVHDISSRFFPGYHLFIFGWFVVALFDDLPEDHKHLTLHCDHYRSKISF
uniref:Uncharacterized protein MANES_14G085000 n=1 Tax=Rhizophora mucronata TaxID=61149 RepID=A0A2P2KYI3_RHIMU